MAFGGWAASHLLRNRPGRREGLERAPFDLRRTAAPADLANPGSKALGALCDGWAFTQPQVVQGTRVLYGFLSAESTRYQRTTSCITLRWCIGLGFGSVPHIVDLALKDISLVVLRQFSGSVRGPSIDPSWRRERYLPLNGRLGSSDDPFESRFLQTQIRVFRIIKFYLSDTQRRECGSRAQYDIDQDWYMESWID